MFEEREEGTLRAVRVSPAGTLNYILSKTVLFSLMGLIYGVMAVLITMGFSVNYFNLIVVVILGSVLMSLIGMIMGALFKNLSEWFFPGVALLMINMLPLFSYGMPVYSPKFIKWIPSYPLIFATRDILFFRDKTGVLGPVVLLIGIEVLVVFALTYLVVHKKMMKDGGS